MSNGFVAILHDNNQLILVQNIKDTNTWRIYDKYNSDNRMPNASITSVNLIKGVFLLIGSRI